MIRANRIKTLMIVLTTCFFSHAGAQTSSSIDVREVEFGISNYVLRNSFSGPGVTWTSNIDLWVSKVLFVSGFELSCSYSPIRPMLAIPNSSNENEQVRLTSSWMPNISSISFRIARTKPYDESNRVHIDTVRCASDYVFGEQDWGCCYTVNEISSSIGDSRADEMSGHLYSDSQYDLVEYTFRKPFSGFIRLRVDNTNTTPCVTACPYLLIPELTVQYDAPTPCSDCFSITIR